MNDLAQVVKHGRAPRSATSAQADRVQISLGVIRSLQQPLNTRGVGHGVGSSSAENPGKRIP